MESSKRNFFSYYSASNGDLDAPCVYEGCVGKGVHKAFRNPRFPKNPVLLCEDHIKIHNQTLDYFEGMSYDDIEKEIRADSLWRRPTWPLGTQQQKFSYYFEDPADIQQRVQKVRGYQKATEKDTAVALPPNVQEAVKVLNLSMPVSFIELKKAYKTKVKQYHPDLNGGSKEAEKKFKEINEAYKMFKKYLF